MVSHRPDPDRLRELLSEARVMLVFTPDLVRERDPLEVLDATLEHVDLVQVRPKQVGPGSLDAVTEARAAHDWSLSVLDVVASRPEVDVAVLVDDRVDVAAALWPRGLAGVHVGQDDCPPGEARDLLSDGPLIGLSTHDPAQVALAGDAPVDYLGFGPIFATPTKGYHRGLGPEVAWVAREAAEVPVFAIGGIDLTNADSLVAVGRVAVGSAILAADDPGAAARTLRALVVDE